MRVEALLSLAFFYKESTRERKKRWSQMEMQKILIYNLEPGAGFGRLTQLCFATVFRNCILHLISFLYRIEYRQPVNGTLRRYG